jgi:hypothetical protein
LKLRVSRVDLCVIKTTGSVSTLSRVVLSCSKPDFTIKVTIH